ncbi:DUF2690 domain-containing protein [Streptomyces sp. NPDC044571]|uniref:DUF2690 domain-containing protein n=1 Tax=Streptomyces sp. NPDC044571 TaxID=3155371 RepID=UPI0033CBE750
MKHRIAAALGTGALLVAGALQAPAAFAAPAATSCLGASCNGLNPANTTCQSDARTVKTGPFIGMELRYSPSCRAAWGRFPHAPKNSRIDVRNSQGKKYTTCGPSGGGTYFSVMVNDKDVKAWACGVFDNGDQTECTGSY